MRADRRTRVRAGVELALAFALLELDLWVYRAQPFGWQQVALYAAFVVILLRSQWRQLQQWRERGPRETVGRARAWGEAIGVSVMLGALVLITAEAVRRSYESFEFAFLLQPTADLVDWLLGKVTGAVGQQIAIQWFLWPVCRELIPNRAGAVGLAALIFGALHFPSLILFGLTVVAALAWIALYERNQRLGPLIVSHVLLFTVAYGALPHRLTYHMNVGASTIGDREAYAVLDDPEIHAYLVALGAEEDRVQQKAIRSDPEGFVHMLFDRFLQRRPDHSEASTWPDALQRWTPAQLAVMVFTSDEYRALARRGAEEPAAALSHASEPTSPTPSPSVGSPSGPGRLRGADDHLPSRSAALHRRTERGPNGDVLVY